MKDINSNLKVVRALDPAVNTDIGTTPLVSEWINRKQSSILFNALLIAIALGDLTDADAVYAVSYEHADDDGAGAVDTGTIVAVPAADIIGTSADFAFGDDDEVRQVGYIGDKQYVRVTITPTTTAQTGNTPVSIVGILGEPTQFPTA
jgi:hypothetical protein